MTVTNVTLQTARQKEVFSLQQTPACSDKHSNPLWPGCCRSRPRQLHVDRGARTKRTDTLYLEPVPHLHPLTIFRIGDYYNINNWQDACFPRAQSPPGQPGC